MSDLAIKLYDPNEDPTNYTVVGDKKMGKTTLIKTLITMLKKNNEACIAYDRLFQFEDILPCYDFGSQIPSGVNKQFCLRRENVTNFFAIAEEYRKQILRENPRGRLYVIIDELDTVYGTTGPIAPDPLTKERLRDWIDYSRHLRVEMWGCVRRPQRIWMNYYEQSNRIFLFHTSGGLAREKLLQTIGSKEMLRAIAKLPKYEFIVYPDELEDYDNVKGNLLNFNNTEKEE